MSYKVVYNSSFGGYGLSALACERLRELGIIHDDEYAYSKRLIVMILDL